MSIVCIETGYQGDVNYLIKRIEFLCQDPEIHKIFKNQAETIEEVYGERLAALSNHSKDGFSKDDDFHLKIHPLKTNAIIINPKSDPRFYKQVRKLQDNPRKKERVLNWLEAFAELDTVAV